MGELLLNGAAQTNARALIGLSKLLAGQGEKVDEKAHSTCISAVGRLSAQGLPSNLDSASLQTEISQVLFGCDTHVVNFGEELLRTGHDLVAAFHPSLAVPEVVAQAASSSAQGASKHLATAEDFCEGLPSVLQKVMMACELEKTPGGGSEPELSEDRSAGDLAEHMAKVLRCWQARCSSRWLIPLALASWCQQLLLSHGTDPTESPGDEHSVGPEEARLWTAVLQAIVDFVAEIAAGSDQDSSAWGAGIQGLAALESSPKFRWPARLALVQQALRSQPESASGQPGAICELLAVLVPCSSSV